MNDAIEPWKVVVLAKAKKEGRSLLNGVQYEHMVEICKRLAYFPYEDEVVDLRIEKMGSGLYELKEKGGPLGRINIRVFFGAISKRKEIVLVTTWKKEREKQTPRHIVLRAENRLEDYVSGVIQQGSSVYAPVAHKAI